MCRGANFVRRRLPPQYMLDIGKQTNQFFDSYVDQYGHKKYRLKSLEQYSREHNTNEQPGKQYFKANSLPDIIRQAPMPSFKSTSRQQHELEKGMRPRHAIAPSPSDLPPIDRDEQPCRIHRLRTGPLEHESN